MKNPDDRHLVIISVPFYRIARVSLSPVVLRVLREHSDIAIVAPFAEAQGFRADFGAVGTFFVKWRLNTLARWQRLLIAISEILRRNGYWRRFRRQGLAYYLANQCRVFRQGGVDTRVAPMLLVAYSCLSFIGQWRRAWQIVDRLLGVRWCELPQLVALSRPYQRVTLIQSANWGLQDRALATLSRHHGWRTVLLPYTTDQLDTNGYLLNDFDAVCIQGSFELARARDVHRVPDERIVRLGSVWFRCLEEIKAALATEAPAKAAAKDFVLYAGVSSLYFPRESEFAAIDAMVGLLDRRGSDLTIVYRALEFDESRREEIRRRCDRMTRVEVQWPSVADVGLEDYVEITQEAALREYVKSLTGCRLMVMSYMTSLSMDMAFLEHAAVISNMIDPSGLLARRHTHLLDTSNTPLRIVTSIPQLLETIEALLNDPVQAAREATDVYAQWDYRADVRKLLAGAIVPGMVEATS